ncbi:26174_t:CDS:2 [Gigaspora margarita]|uniref:26174_t:CDS:1 n=1 Tax=Gigaspora margarita TaxID=4874 RepID=A0ABN7VXC6_GIGMA|nr:26174_t:CDS:2 [Gigaspora margarita]
MGGYISKSRCNFKHKHPLTRSPSFKDSSSRVPSRIPSRSPSAPNLPTIIEPYSLPAQNSVDALQIAHYMFRAIWGSNYSAPVADVLKKEGSCVLDIRCGPGTWTLEMSDEFPGSYFTGIDAAIMYPTEIKPRNVKFTYCANWLENLDFPDDYFDYVYVNFLCFGLTKNDWENKLLPEIIRVLKPGGYIEISPCDLKWYNEGPIAKQWLKTVHKELKARNIEPAISSQIVEILEQTGSFSQVYSDERDHPVGSWGGEIGKTTLGCLKYYFDGLKRVLENSITCDNGKTFEFMRNDLIDEIEEQNMYSKCIRYWAMKI